ncbi:MAG: ABC transporter ATP-binding protein [Desulfobacula sp.]|uniref:ABC transporter ATP-binding protein n=1 Tax=Desulfobacula sp. TaxID=2593537 RepID=UPI0025C20DAE|nr:ABC transporter ATP-binding protein [Desulfobacula sp.]MCD4721311.1 ABC transporter ATP-binding protein [Desulfobacula sp.]
MSNNEHILNVRDLKTYFYTLEGVAKAVDDVSFHANPGETLGIVGESGSGKSVSVLSIMRLIKNPPGKIVSGRIEFDGTNLLELPENKMRKIRGNRISMIFQEPMTSLNPVFTIGNQIAEMFVVHQGLNKKDSLDRAIDMLDRVKIPSPRNRAQEFPHQLSGGMRQRAMIAMALACNPEILIADEPTTALDVTIQAQILELMLELKEQYNTAVLMITHDLGVIAEIAQRVVVMYAGKVVEEGPTKDLFENPKHPYTKGLLQSIPILGRRAKYGRDRLTEIPGIVPSLYELPKGCSFQPRCQECIPECRVTLPDLRPLELERKVRCHLY